MVEELTEGFSIGVLAARSGLTPTVLRTWDNRFGFPAGARAASGHRRFTDADVDLVREVLEVRASGVALGAAIESVQRRRRRPLESVHAVLARDFPHLGVQRLRRRALVAASYAVEDEALARAERPLVLGSFQTGHRFDDQRDRWDELGRTAAWSAVLADFAAGAVTRGEPVAADPSATPARCQLPEGSALRREWTVVTVSESRAALVSAWEVPAPTSAAPVYESVVSSHRPAAVAAARVLLDAARAGAATPPAEVGSLLDAPGTPDTPTVDTDRMWMRAIARLDGTR